MTTNYYGRDMENRSFASEPPRQTRERPEAYEQRQAYPQAAYDTRRPGHPPNNPRFERDERVRPGVAFEPGPRRGPGAPMPPSGSRGPQYGPGQNQAYGGNNMYRPQQGHPPQRPPRQQYPPQMRSPQDHGRPHVQTPLFVPPVRTKDYPRDHTTSPQEAGAQGHGVQWSPAPAGFISEVPHSQNKAQQSNPPNLEAQTVKGNPKRTSSFYSKVSFGNSPLVADSPRSRSHGSYASSAAMPAAWGNGLPPVSNVAKETNSPMSENESPNSAQDEFGDERMLMPRPLRQTREDHKRTEMRQPDASGKLEPGFQETSALNSKRHSKTGPPMPVNSGPTPDALLKAYAAASSSEPTNSPQDFKATKHIKRLSSMPLPPKSDKESVGIAGARASTTSLSDLILRATKLATMIDKERRPVSRLDQLTEVPDEKISPIVHERAPQMNYRNSGLSDMLASFPPPAQASMLGTAQTPAQARQSVGPNRTSWFRRGDWPLGAASARRSENSAEMKTSSLEKRRCCGMPIWLFVVMTLLLLCAIVAAVVIPLEFFVFKNFGSDHSSKVNLEECQKQLSCLNGGTNVISQGMCSCICTGGFTGVNCNSRGSAGCTTTNLISRDGTTQISNVTIGLSIPRLVADAAGNFSLAISGTVILAKFSSSNLSCIAQNSLVTFNGRSMRSTTTTLSTGNQKLSSVEPNLPSELMIVHHSHQQRHTHASMHHQTHTHFKDDKTLEGTGTIAMHLRERRADTTTNEPSTTAKYKVTEQALDFARVAVLYILQQLNLDSAETVQQGLEAVFQKTKKGDAVSFQDASNIAITNIGTFDLVKFSVSLNH